MNIKHLSLAIAVMLGLVTFSPAFALEVESGASVGAGARVTDDAAKIRATASSTVKLGAVENKAKERGSQEIERRVKSLTELNARVQQMQNVTADFKQNLNTYLLGQISALGALKGKIDADDDIPTLKSDVQSITQSYRVYALVIPQGRIAAAADRMITIFGMMNTLGSKLQARIQAAGQAGNDTTALTAALTNMSAKLNDAKTQAQTAASLSSSLQPDNGDSAKMQANTKALQDARAAIVAGEKDLQAARKDAATILKGLKGMSTGGSASSTTQTTITP